MADEPEAPPKPAGKGIGAKLGKKLGPLPVWGWALVGVVGAVVAYRWYQAKQAAAAGGAASASEAVGAGTTASGAPEAGSAGASGSDNGYSDGGSSQLQDLLTQLQSQLPSATSTAAGGGAAPSTGAYQGFGYAAPSGGYETAGGTSYQQLSTLQQIQAAVSNKIPLFAQIEPGDFTPYTGNTPTTAANFAGSTPLFIQSSYSSGPAVSGAAAPTTTAAPSPVTSGPTGTSLGSVPVLQSTPGPLAPMSANPIV